MDLILYTIRSIAYVIVEPSFAFILVLLGIISYLKNKKIAIMQRMILGESINSPLELTLSQMVLGVIAGAIGSLILNHLGIVFPSESGIIIIFIISIMLMFINPRFACFSYSGAILGIISIISGIGFAYMGKDNPIKIDIMGLVILVGVLHIMEGFLIMIDGSRGAVPVFSNRDGRILGGFALNRLWIIPVSIFIAVDSQVSGVGFSINTPDFWPLVSTKQNMLLISTMVLTLVPNFAGVIYSSVTFSKSKRQKAFTSGMYVLGFGIILTLISKLCLLGIIGDIMVILFMPIGHEVMIYLQRRAENKNKPIYISDDTGISILEVIPYTPAYESGIRSGDKVISVNGNKVDSESEVYKIIKESYMPINFEIKKLKGNIVNYTIKSDERRRIGIVLVPKLIRVSESVKFDSNKFKDILEELKNKVNKKDE